MRLIKTPLVACVMVAAVMGAKAYFPYWSSVAFLEHSLLFLAGFIAGVRLPDLDLVMPGLTHRSGITHACLIPLLCWWFFFGSLAGGLALGMALHMASDVQPKAWTGGALIRFPFLGNIGMLSPFWLIANVIGCSAILLEMMAMTSRLDRQMILVICIFCTAWYFLKEEKKPMLPLMTMGFSLLLVYSVRNGLLSLKMLSTFFEL